MRDKPISEPNIFYFISKTNRFDCKKVFIVAVSNGQKPLPTSEIYNFAEQKDVTLLKAQFRTNKRYVEPSSKAHSILMPTGLDRPQKVRFIAHAPFTHKSAVST